MKTSIPFGKIAVSSVFFVTPLLCLILASVYFFMLNKDYNLESFFQESIWFIFIFNFFYFLSEVKYYKNIQNLEKKNSSFIKK